jgi:AAA+ superfamily predicted ATPase
MNDVKDLTLILRSRFPIVVVETHEEPQVLELIERAARLESQALFIWNAADGLRRRDSRQSLAPGGRGEAAAPSMIPETRDIAGALKHIYATSQNGIYVLLDVHPYLQDPINLRLIKNAAQEYGKTARTIVMVGHKIELPGDLRRLSARFDLVLPDAQAIRALVKEEAEAYAMGGAKLKGQQETLDLLVQQLAGLALEDARRVVRQCIRDDGALTAEDMGRALKSKQDLLGANSVIDVELETTRFSDVAGLVHLKRWLTQRRPAFVGDAKAMGLDPPKGVLLLGVQGAGKSLAAKAVAGTWGVPLLRLDFSTIYNKWLGETERNLREALRFADAMAPCVLWMDEIEKGVATGSSDGGESRRLLGSILTWMAERSSRVFMVATANDIEQLPPELIRKGRFDEIFFVDLPDAPTRAEILRIHLARRSQDAAGFDLDGLARASDYFSGAEIEQAVVSALYEAVASGQKLATEHVLAEMQRTRPLAIVMAEKIAALREWARERTVSAG